MLIGKIFCSIFGASKNFFNSNAGKTTMKVGIGVGAGLTATGTGLAVNASSKNKKAIKIQKEAIKSHDNKLLETESVLAVLADVESKCISNFKLFISLVEKIGEFPLLRDFDSAIKLPKITYQELKENNTAYEMALAGVAGSGVGGLAGLAFCGIGIGTAGLAVVGGGIVLCIKGAKLRSQSVSNLNKAKKFEKDVEKIIVYYDELQNASNLLKDSIVKVNGIYEKKLIKLESLVNKNNNYKSFSTRDKKLTENCRKLTVLLASMCRTRLAKRRKEKEFINLREIEKISYDSKVLLQESK